MVSPYLSAIDGLTQSYTFKQKLQNREPIDLSHFVVYLRERHVEYWTPHSETHPREHNNKHSTYQKWCALPTRRDLVTHSPYILPKYMLLNLPREVIRSAARFRLCVHTLRFATATGIKVIPAPVTCVILIMSKMSRMFCSTVPIPT